MEEIPIKKCLARGEVLPFFERCNEQIFIKACSLNQETSAVNTGDDSDRIDSFGLAITSTPYPKKLDSLHKDSKKQKDYQNQKNSNTTNNLLTVSKIITIVENERKNDAVSKAKMSIIAREKLLAQERVAEELALLQALDDAKSMKLHEEKLQFLKEEEENAAQRKQYKQLQLQEHAQRVSKRDEQIRAAERQKKEAEAEKRKKIAEIMKYTEQVHHYLCEFSDTFNKIQLEFKSCHTLAPIVNESRPLHLGMQTLIQRVKSGEVDQSCVDVARDLCKKINLVYTDVLEELVKIKKQSEERETTKQQESIQPHVHVTQAHDAGTVSSETVHDSVNELSDCASKECLQWFQELKRYKESNERLFEQLVKDDRLKKYRFDCQKAVNIPVNAISPTSASHLRDKLQKLTLLLSGQPVMVGDGVRVSAAQHPAGIPFCKDLLAKKFVRQGASTVSSKPEAAYAIAAVMAALWQDFPDWGQLLLAHFHQECPYLVPVFWPQLEGQSNREYYLSLGYTYNEDGEVEKQDKFLKRMSGIMRLYAALLISRLPRDRQNRPHPHDLGQGWRWLTNILNIAPRPDICASLLFDFLEVTGSSMLEQYGRQYHKLLLAICKGYFPRLQKSAVSSSGPVVRLETFLQTILKQGGSKPPHGMLPVNFW